MPTEKWLQYHRIVLKDSKGLGNPSIPSSSSQTQETSGMLTHEHVDFFLNDRQNNCQTNNPIPTKYVLYLLQTLSCWFQLVRCCTLMHSEIQRKCSMNVKPNLCTFIFFELFYPTLTETWFLVFSSKIQGVVRSIFSCNSWNLPDRNWFTIGIYLQ